MGGMNYTVMDSKKLATAEVFGKTLCELGEKDKRVISRAKFRPSNGLTAEW